MAHNDKLTTVTNDNQPVTSFICYVSMVCYAKLRCQTVKKQENEDLQGNRTETNWKI